MSILEHDLTLLGSKGRRRLNALFDSGASYSIIRRDVAEELELLTPIPDPENYIFETARPGELIPAHYRVTLELRFEESGARFSDEFIVFDDCSERLIIGVATMQKWSITLDFDREEILYRKTARRLRV